jgi:amidase
MNFADYARLDGLALAELVRKRDVTPSELVDIAIARAEAVNPTLNFMVYADFERARASARDHSQSGLFAGVPFFLKDILAFAKGTPTRQGARYVPPVPWPHDSVLTTRFREAGLIVLGRTNVPEFGLVPTTESKLYGPAHNPFDLSRSTGGSSGGSAAAVAAGVVPVAHANDGGGSIRIPASCCGLVGLKPTRARAARSRPMPASASTGWSSSMSCPAACATRRRCSMRPPAACLAIPIGHLPDRIAGSLNPQRRRSDCASPSRCNG